MITHDEVNGNIPSEKEQARQKEEQRFIATILQMLHRMQSTATREDFERMYGEAIGGHFWKEFIKNDHQVPLVKLSGNSFAPLAQHIQRMIHNETSAA